MFITDTIPKNSFSHVVTQLNCCKIRGNLSYRKTVKYLHDLFLLETKYANLTHLHTPYIKMKQTETYYKTLWTHFREGDKDALAEIYSDFVGVLYNYGFNICQDPFVVQDAIQDLFVDLWRMRATLSEAQSVKFYLFRSLRRRLHKAIEAQHQTTSFEENYGLSATLLEENSIDEAEYTQKIKQLHQHITTLPPRQVEAIRLRFFEGFSLAQIAELMDMNEQSVRNSINRAVQKLRQTFVYWSWLFIVISI